jgi:PadR family transcriptional regulator, regulatory protein PadR
LTSPPPSRILPLTLLGEKPKTMARTSLDLMHGTVAVLILKTLSWGPMHGYDVSRTIRQRSEGALGLEDAALYQALHRLESKRWIESEWGVSENNRKAKFYRLTDDGRKQLQLELSTWQRYATAVSKVLETA